MALRVNFSSTFSLQEQQMNTKQEAQLRGVLFWTHLISSMSLFVTKCKQNVTKFLIVDWVYLERNTHLEDLSFLMSSHSLHQRQTFARLNTNLSHFTENQIKKSSSEENFIALCFINECRAENHQNDGIKNRKNFPTFTESRGTFLLWSINRTRNFIFRSFLCSLFLSCADRLPCLFTFHEMCFFRGFPHLMDMFFKKTADFLDARKDFQNRFAWVGKQTPTVVG